MATPDDAGETNLSRRRFIKWAGGSLAAGTAAVALGGVALQRPAVPAKTREETSARPRSCSEATLGSPEQLPEGAFSVFWITDTQFLSESNPALFKMLNNWIVENWTRFNGRLVIHTGDIVQNGPVEQEWLNADDAMSVLLSNHIPYTWCAGNHDDLVSGDATSGWRGRQWTNAFDPSVVSPRVNALPYVRWAGDYHDGMNTALSFSANGLDFLVVSLEWNAQPDVLRWVGSVLDDPAYAGHHVIVAPHAYIDASGSLDDPRWAAQLKDFTAGLTEMMDERPSVFLTLNGHFATECGYNTPHPINNRNELMFDRQDCADDPEDVIGRGVDNPPPSDGDKVGGATATVLMFDAINNQIRARTYDFFSGKWRTYHTEQYEVVMFPNLVTKPKLVAQ
jgi:hypothetical protein